VKGEVKWEILLRACKTYFDYAQTFADLNSATTGGGYSVKKVLLAGNAVMKKFLAPALKWQFNRHILPIGITNSWQQDYATNLWDVAFLQDGHLLEINNTCNPRPIHNLEAVQNLTEMTAQYSRPTQICALLNRDLQYVTWGAVGLGTGNNTNGTVGPNPQPNQEIINPIGITTSPANPFLQVRDPNGNLWILTQFGTTGPSQPTWPNPVVYPSMSKPSVVPTQCADGSCMWTAVNPFNFGFRLAPIPPQTGIPYQIFPTYQMRPPQFTSLGQYLDPIPDDYAPTFMDGMVAHLYQSVTDAKIRLKHSDSIALWEKSFKESRQSMDRTRDAAIMFPADSIMGGSCNYYPNAAFPFSPA
jgi:hypothetical protein